MIKNKITAAPPRTFTNQANIIDMPEGEAQDIIFESFIETDKLKAKGGELIYIPKSGYLEMTVGSAEEREN